MKKYRLFFYRKRRVVGNPPYAQLQVTKGQAGGCETARLSGAVPRTPYPTRKASGKTLNRILKNTTKTIDYCLRWSLL